VFVESESKKIGSLRLPQSLMDSMGSADLIEISAPLPVRLKVWEADFGHFIQDPAALMERVQHLLPLVGHETIKNWRSLAEAGDVPKIFEQLMTLHYDPAYKRSGKRLFQGHRTPEPLTISAYSEQAFTDAAAQLIALHGSAIDVE
jgi:tRNA 2-selenouridine synthase